MTLNVLPGLSGGYPYQIRGQAYWITYELATSSHLFVLRAVIGQDAEAAEEMQNQLVYTRRACDIGSRNGSRG